MEMRELTIRKREGIGKGPARRLRRAGQVPATLYGGASPVNVAVTPKDVLRLIHGHEGSTQLFRVTFEGTTDAKMAIIRDMQFDPVSESLIHVDLQEVAMDRAIHERGEPQDAREMGIGLGDLAQGAVGHERNLAGGQRADAVVHLFEKEGVQVGEVAGDVERRDLPSAVSEAVVTASEALQDEAALSEGVALAHDVLPGSIVPDPRRDFAQHVLLLIGEGTMPFKSADERMRHAPATCE